MIDGLEAQGVTLTGLRHRHDRPDGQAAGRLASQTAPQLIARHLDIVFLVREGNPKGIVDRGDLVAEGVQAITPNPKTSGGARGATTTFAQRGIGDVLLARENEAFLSLKELSEAQCDIVVPSISVLAEPPVPLNAAFGIAAARSITRSDFSGKAFLITLIDLPFSVRPAVAGQTIVPIFGGS